MSQTYSLPEYKINVVKQSAFDTGATGGTLTEGLPYEIGDATCPEVFQGVAAPTSATTCSHVGDFYIAVISNNLRVWQCVAINGNAYTWREQIRDVQVNGTSITANGVSNIPYASNDDVNGGIVKLSNAGISIDANTHIIRTVPATYIALNSGAGNYSFHPVCASAVGLATKKALGVTLDSSTSNKDWTDAEKSTARNTIGAYTAVEYTGSETSYADQTWYYTTEI